MVNPQARCCHSNNNEHFQDYHTLKQKKSANQQNHELNTYMDTAHYQHKREPMTITIKSKIGFPLSTQLLQPKMAS
jgi:hypothetical protein